jgi:hypothetical protein
MHPDAQPSPLGELVAEVFLERLQEQGFRSSNRHMVDYLPTEVGVALACALLELTETEVPVRLPDDAGGERIVQMKAIPRAGLDVLPYLVVPDTDPSIGSNQGTEGYASCLRDHYAVDALRPRLLVVITPEGNETQNSARDTLADKALVTLEHLLQAILERSSVPRESPLVGVAGAYRAHQGERVRWERMIEDFQSYVDEVAKAPPEVQGAKLPMLGCFLADARPDFATGARVQVLDDKEQRRRQRGEGRLYDNALLHEFLKQSFADPIVDPENVLVEVLENEPEKAREIARGGNVGLKRLDLGTFAGVGPRQLKRQKNGLDRTSLVVKDAALHRSFGQGSDTLLVVTSPGPFTVTFRLNHGFKARKEHAQIGRWDYEKNKLDLRPLSVADGASEVAFCIEPTSNFSVWRVALTSGPRSLRSTIDHVLVVVYRSDAPELVVEERRLASLEDQAWVAEGQVSFHLYTDKDEGAQPVEVVKNNPVDATRDAEARRIFDVVLDGCELVPRVIDNPDGPAPEEDGQFAYEPLLELACTTVRRGPGTTAALRKHDHYLDAVAEIHESNPRYKVDLDSGDTREIWADLEESGDPFRRAQAVAQLLVHPQTFRLDWRGNDWVRHAPPPKPPASIQRFLELRQDVLYALRKLAEAKLPRFRRVQTDAAVPLFLLSMRGLGSLVEDLLQAWNAAVSDTVDGVSHFSAWHDLLLQTDTLRVLGEDGGLSRLVVLPTHPWLLGALAAFQERFSENLRRMGTAKKGRQLELDRSEVQQMIPRAVEDWYVWQSGVGRLLSTDSPPFHFDFVPETKHTHRSPLDYVSGVVANKIGRYLRMHPHLRDERRTLRLGFVNPSDGGRLLKGLEQWLRNTMREHAGRIRDLPMEQIPAIDVFLFSDRPSEGVGSELERFFRQQVSAVEEDVIQQTLLARIQYRFCQGRGPSSARDAVHICFLYGLVDGQEQQGKTASLGDWWDGGFGDGLLATYLRRTDSSGHGLRSRRGLWLDPDADGLRGALARLMSLHRGCRDSDLALGKALFWETPLPDLKKMAPTYEHSDWVVHLDRELSLEIFRRGSAEEIPTIIEYSDQEVPESPGYDTITATRHATPYHEQLGEILTTVDLDVAGQGEEARTAANAILDDINVLSGSWALDFLMGSIADLRTSTRLKGNVGAALVYRWLKRMEMERGKSTLESNVGPVVPVFISLEDLLRATPSVGLKRKEGLVYRYTNEVDDRENAEAAKWCDDLLVLYLTRSEKGSPSRIFGRVIEVKFGKGATSTKTKAIEQVKATQKLLQDRLSGDRIPLDAPFRDKQLSLLIKAQLEQSVAMGVLGREVYELLNVPALSANLATGAYKVDYTIALDNQHLAGDAFLLQTTPSEEEDVTTELLEGVRILTLPRKLVQWLAFELPDSQTLTSQPRTTLPRLGRYTSVETQAGTSKRAAVSPTPAVEVKPPEPAAESSAAPLPETAPREPTEAAPSQSLPLPMSFPPAPTPRPEAGEEGSGPDLKAALLQPIKVAPYPDQAVVDAVQRLERALVGHKIQLASSPSARETDRGPRLLRVYVRLEAGESISSVRRISEDIARVVGTTSSDIHITNVPERHAIGLDLPLNGLTYSVSFDELVAHPSFEAARREMTLGFCAGIDVTGRPVWVDLASMPHMLVAGTTGSGKTVFLRNLILTLLKNNRPNKMLLRLSSSKPMDFRVFTQAPHAQGRDMARDPAEASQLAKELILEMERRYHLIDEAICDNLAEFNAENPERAEPYIVAVFDEYSEMIASFSEKGDREAFESALGRLAQKARAAGIHLVVCMQRPDANALKGAIKANILHRFALKLPQNHDSRIILDETGAETLLGQGDMLYKDANSSLFRLQVPFLENATLKREMAKVSSK